MIVRWGLEALPDVLEELSVKDALLISTERWRAVELPAVRRRFYGAQPHADLAGVREARGAADLGVAAGGAGGRRQSRCPAATARRRDARRLGTPGRDGPRPRDRPGARRTLRTRPRHDERGIAAAGAALQPGRGGGGDRTA